MAEDIASLLAQSGRVDLSSFDPSAIVDSYRKGKEWRYQQDGRELFKEGVPRRTDGSIDYGAMRDVLFKRGDLGSGMALDNLDLQRQQLKASMELGATAFPSAGNDALPPSPSRNAGTVVAPPVTRAAPRGQYAGADVPGSIVGLISTAGVPDELAGPIIQQASALTKTDPNAPLDPRRTQIVQQIIARNRPSAPEPASSDETLGGLVPRGRSPQQQIDLLSRAALQATPAAAKVYQERIKAIQDAITPTQEMKNARASGMSLPDYQSQTDQRTADRDVLTKSLIPELEKSRDKASAAADEIQSIHTARDQLNANGGIFTGTAADVRLKLAKAASLLGVADADKIANTEAFSSAIGARVLSLVKGLGAGAGISNADRDFAAAMAGGNIKLDDKSIRRILDIGEQAARIRIDKHNKYADRIRASNDALGDKYRDVYGVQAPSDYQAPKAASTPSNQSFSEGQTATNAKTGQKIVFQAGKWVPVK